MKRDRIEELRNSIHKDIESGKYNLYELVEKSQKLDRLIVKYMEEDCASNRDENLSDQKKEPNTD